MSAGVSRTADISAGIGQVVYTLDFGVFTGNIRLTNRNSVSVKVRLAICTGASPTLAEYIEYDAIIPPNDVLEETAIIMVTGEKIYIFSDLPGISARVHGIEEVF